MPEQGESEDLYLSNHCAAMRRALQHCLDKSRDLTTTTISCPPLSTDGPADDGARGAEERSIRMRLIQAHDAARSLPRYRQDNLESFHASAASNALSECEQRPAIAWVEALGQISPLAFRRAYEHANLPCKVVGLPNECFGNVHQHVVAKCGQQNRSDVADAPGRDNHDNEDAAGSSERQVVNRSWFLETLGPETAVPVRMDPSHATAAHDACPDSETAATVLAPTGLDADGRATECETTLMALRHWIDLLDSAAEASLTADQGEPATDAAGVGSVPSLYLKDWHLQAFVNRQNRTATRPCKNVESNERESAVVAGGLYRVPAHFGHDLLNHFLTTFFVDEDGSYNSDYYFCYWGPTGSRTARHSDVLNSFSWSYNVCGHKEWTFYPPPLPTSGNETNPGEIHRTAEQPIVLHQRAGECVVVPSGWQHSVINCEETLSFNHNCVTTSNVDLVWSCLCQEMGAIERELAAWDAPAFASPNECRSRACTDGVEPLRGSEADNDHWDARESMLRGCVGLDVTAFYLMIAFGVVERLSRGTAEFLDLDGAWEFVFDLTRLNDMLQMMLQSESLHLAQRLQASLGDPYLATKAHGMGESILEHVNERIRVLLLEAYS
jgi:JmjC domain, hydroxylase